MASHNVVTRWFPLLVGWGLLLAGCGGVGDDLGERVAHNARTPEFLWCGWAPSTRFDMDPLDAGQCWFVTPPDDRRLGLTSDPCSAQSSQLELPGGTRMHVFARVGSEGDNSQGRLKYVIKECTGNATGVAQ